MQMVLGTHFSLAGYFKDQFEGALFMGCKCMLINLLCIIIVSERYTFSAVLLLSPNNEIYEAAKYCCGQAI